MTFECVHRRVTAHESNLFQGPELSRAFQQHKVEPKLYHHTNHYSSKVLQAVSVTVRASEGTAEARPIGLGRQRIMATAESA